MILWTIVNQNMKDKKSPTKADNQVTNPPVNSKRCDTESVKQQINDNTGTYST